MEIGQCSTMRELLSDCSTSDNKHSKAKDFEPARYEQRKTIVDQVMVCMELKTIKS